ncbi:MAG: hypothetical protein ACP5KD_05775 [Fervidobacterium sp.]
MGVLTIEVDAQKLKDVVKRSDRVCGTLEPSNRRLAFFAQDGKLYALASDGCLKGSFELSPYLFSRSFQPFEISLDVLKQFSSELSGKVNLLIQDGIITFKCQNEILRLKVNYVDNIQIQKIAEKGIKMVRRKFLSEIDYSSCFLEEGNNVDVFISGNLLELISHYAGILSYVKLNVGQNELTGASYSISIPYVSSRHVVKALDLEESEEIIIYYDEYEKKLHLKSTHLYTLCGDTPAENPERVRNVCSQFKVHSKISASQLQKLLRRSLISGRFSDVQLYTRLGEVVVVSQYGSIAYKGSMEADINAIFSVKTKANLLRSALNRIGSQNILVDVIDDFVVFSSPSLTRFLILRNERVQ